jgi:hypothetical protein
MMCDVSRFGDHLLTAVYGDFKTQIMASHDKSDGTETDKLG